MDKTNEGAEEDVAVAEAEVETLQEESKEVQDTTDWKAKFEEADGKLRRAQTKLEKSKIEKKAEELVKEKTGELDETTLDWFDLKGYSDSDEVDIFHKVMQKTGMSAREAVKDEWALSKVKSLRDANEVKGATPSSTKRGGSGSNDLALAIAKFEQSGFKDLPEDFTLRSAVVNAIEAKRGSNKPSWH